MGKVFIDYPLTFTVEGRPVPKQRAKLGRTRSGRSVAYYPERGTNSKRLSYPEYKEVVQAEALKKLGAKWSGPDDAYYKLYVMAHVKSAGSGDVDNILGTIMDALQGIIWLNDSQVLSAWPEKVLGARKPRVLVEVIRM